ncbi:helix-turn-helix transcriptional regulator [Achromobacter xylosoxidans]|uniref:helix-turn-helix transcriptional regulator n=1 Tax=Alcaligenes xylosoxydans xylosoxydans TaxID=85698 RepID=UPI001F12CA1F|nr:AlpA family phage regulatory protein [Achromobacter xylosoxidans]
MREQGESLLPLKVVQSRVGMGKTKIYEQIKAGVFPACIKNGRTSVWVASEVDGWIARTIAQAKTTRQP